MSGNARLEVTKTKQATGNAAIETKTQTITSVSYIAPAKQSIVVIGDRATVTGFRLAGINHSMVAQPSEAAQKIEAILDQGNTSILVVTEKLMAGLDWRLKKKIERTAKPVIVAVPDKSGPAVGAESLKDLIKKTLGLELAK